VWFFSRPYLCNGQAYGTVVVCFIVVCLSVVILNGCFVAKHYVVGGNFLHELLALCLKTRHAKLHRSSAKGTFSNSGLNGWGVGKSAFFNGKLAVSWKRWEIQQRLLLITNRKWHMSCQRDGNHWPWMTFKVTDIRYGQLS